MSQKIVLIGRDDKYFVFPNDYYLIDEADSGTKKLPLLLLQNALMVLIF